jgi:hypothetical protein
MRSCPRSRFLIPALLAVALTGCATPTFEERLSYLDLLKSRGTITEDEYAIMRRRLVETVDLATLRAPDGPPAPPAEPEEPPGPLSTEWVVGSWRGTYVEGQGAYPKTVETVVEFSLAREGLQWRMTQRLRYMSCLSVAEASGSAVVRDDELEMTGTYINGRCLVSEGTPVDYRLRRVGRSLEALSEGTDPLTRALVLHRIQP